MRDFERNINPTQSVGNGVPTDTVGTKVKIEKGIT